MSPELVLDAPPALEWVDPAVRHPGRCDTGAVIEVLGDVRLGGEPEAIGSRNQRLVVAVLAAHHGRTVSADVLIDSLWEGDPPPTARRTLGSYVSRLRARVGDTIEIHPGGYRLAVDADGLDALRFEELVERARSVAPVRAAELLAGALAMWRGSAFGEFADLEPVRAAATRLDILAIEARERRAEALLRAGRSGAAAAAAGELVVAEPLRESAWAVLVEAQARTAPGEALRTYRRAEAALAEVGLVPSEALRAAESRVLLGGTVDELEVSSGLPPPNRSSFVGRGEEMVQIGLLLDTERLVTLVGPGGVGKTRLAIEVARHHGPDHPRGAHLVALDEIVEAEAVAPAITEVLGVAGVANSPDEQLALAGGLDVLIVLDNCEHVLDAAAAAVEVILDGGSLAKVIATSRQRLGVEGERIWTTRPLAVHSGADSDEPFAVRLFVERAAAAGIDVTSDPEAVVRVVDRLDGLPLAIEMAAAMLTSVGLADLERITRSDPTSLHAPTRGTPSRQRTLATLVDWSLDALGEESRQAIARLTVFDGAFDLAAAAALVDTADTPTRLVHELVERSLLNVDTATGTSSYRMLWTVKGRVQRRTEDDELTTARRRHADFHVERLADDDRLLRTDEVLANRRIADAYPELRSAHLWATEHDIDTAVRLTRHLHVWALSRQVGDPFRWAQRLLGDRATGPPAAVAAHSQALFYAGRPDEAVAVVEAAMSVADGLDRLLLLESLGDVTLAQGDLDRAISLGSDLAAAADELGDLHFVVIGTCAQALAHGYAGRRAVGLDLVSRLDAGAPTDSGWIDYTIAELTSADDPEGAAHRLGRAIIAADSVDNRFLGGVARVSLSSLRAGHGHPAEAITDLVDTIEHWRQRGMHSYLMTSLRNLVVLLDRLDRPDHVPLLIGAIESRSRVPTFGAEAAQLADVAERCERRLGHHRFRSLRARGAVEPFEQVIRSIVVELGGQQTPRSRLRDNPVRSASPVESVVVRDAEFADVDVLREVFRAASLSNEHDQPHLLARPELLEWDVDPVSEGRTRVAVATGRVVGFITTATETDSLEVDDLFVDPRWMRQGIGRALVLDAAASARARGIRRLTVEANDHALDFYERVGFVSRGVARTPFGSAARMVYELAPEV